MYSRPPAHRTSSWVLLQVLVLSVAVYPCLALPPMSLPTASGLHQYARRQDAMTSTSSFDYWWPYPSWGALTSTTAAVTSDPGATPTTVDLSTAAVTSNPIADVITPTVADSTTSGGISSATTSTSDNYIHITALPPANSASSVTRLRNSINTGHSKPFQIVYLAPLFAVLGAIAGALCTWLLYRFVPARSASRKREPSLEPGPRYTPPSRFRQVAALTPAPPEEENLVRPSQSSARPLLDATTTEQKKGSWLSHAFSTRSRAAPQPVEQRSESAGAGDEAEDDPFLDHRSPTAASGGLGRHGTARTTFSQRLTSPDPYGGLVEEDLAPYQTLRHKSIRRGILERLRFGTLRRPPAEYERSATEDDGPSAGLDASPSAKRHTSKRRGHKRDSSDMTVAADMRSRTTSSEDADALSRRPTLARNRSEAVVSPPGFRLVVEDPESGALMSAPPSRSASPTKQDGPAWGWNLLWQPSPTKTREGDDKFTALPVRRDRRGGSFASPSPSSRALSALSADDDVADADDGRDCAAPPPIRRVDSSVLPASPPMVRSPPLDSQLFFGAVSPDFGSSPSLNLRLPEVPPKDPPAHAHARASLDEKPATKLRTQRSPPQLPFPSTASTSPFRGRLKKTPTRRTPARPVTVERNDSADSVDAPVAAGRGTPAQRHDARSSALSKVSEILSRGWGERQVVGSVGGAHGGMGAGAGDGARAPFLGSPELLSGGPSLEKLIDEEALNGVGIEQRLGALMGSK